MFFKNFAFVFLGVFSFSSLSLADWQDEIVPNALLLQSHPGATPEYSPTQPSLILPSVRRISYSYDGELYSDYLYVLAQFTPSSDGYCRAQATLEIGGDSSDGRYERTGFSFDSSPGTFYGGICQRAFFFFDVDDDPVTGTWNELSIGIYGPDGSWEGHALTYWVHMDAPFVIERSAMWGESFFSFIDSGEEDQLGFYKYSSQHSMCTVRVSRHVFGVKNFYSTSTVPASYRGDWSCGDTKPTSLFGNPADGYVDMITLDLEHMDPEGNVDYSGVSYSLMQNQVDNL